MRTLVALAALVALAMAGSAAASVSHAPSGTIAAPVGDAVFGGSVSFPYAVDGLHGREATYTEITAACSQDGVKVWGDTQFAAGNSFVLGGTFWSPWIVAGGGAADCTATLFYFDNHDAVVALASVDFQAGA